MFCDGRSMCLRSTLGQGLHYSRSLRRMYHQMNGRLSGNGITSKSDLCSITLCTFSAEYVQWHSYMMKAGVYVVAI